MALSRRQVLLGAGVAVPASAILLARAARRDPALAPSKEAVVREATTVLAAESSVDGAGVRLRRALGGRALGMLDPFLLLDEIKSDDPNDYAAGFPDHPHRGFETVTYMRDGAMEHKDSVGNRGRLGPGSAQWMTAGHGIVHSEMPKQERGVLWGFQLWVNLPAKDKMQRPRYQDIAATQIPEVAGERTRVRVVAGDALGVTGPVNGIATGPVFVDVALERRGIFELPLEADHASFVYVTDGAVRLGSRRREVREGELAVLSEGDAFEASCDADHGRFLLFAGRRIGEPVARRGPFVMNTDAELRQAFEDYRAGRLTSG